MARLRYPGRVLALVFSLLLLWGGSARAEFKTLKLPKAGEFQIDLSAIVQETPPFPEVVKEGNHYVFTGLEAWGLDKKYMSTFQVYVSDLPVDPTIVSAKDVLEDRMVVYCEDSFWEDHSFPVTVGKQEGRIELSPADPQKTMLLQFRDKKDKNITWRFYGNGDVTICNGKNDSEATYEGGILKEAYYPHTVGKVTGNYYIRCGGMAGGEYCYELSELNVSSKKEKLDETNNWNRVTGWTNPEDPKIKPFTKAEFPFTFTSAAGTPFRVMAPVMSAEKGPAAEDLSGFFAGAEERKLYPTLAAFGLPEFPACEEIEGSGECHVTGLKRWGLPEDELTVSPGSTPAYSFAPDIPGIREMYIWYSGNYPGLSISLFTETGSFSISNYRGNYTVSVNSPGEMAVEYHYLGGYLNSYSLRTENLYHFHYEPAFTLNESTMAEGLLPPFGCCMITNAQNAGERWTLKHGEWDGAIEPCGPCPFDDSQVPPPLAYAE